MSTVLGSPPNPAIAAEALRPPRDPRDSTAYKLFGDLFSAMATLVALGLALCCMQKVVNWGVFEAVWPGQTADICRQADGACWAFLAEKFRLIVFGIYPPGAQWRPGVVCVFIAVMTLYSLNPKRWRRSTA